MAIELFQHPQFTAMEAEYRLYNDLNEGRHATMKSPQYLWMHELEHAVKDGAKYRSIRELRSRYTNLFEPVESTWVSMALRDEVDIDDETRKLFGDHINDVDGEGHDLKSFLMLKVAPAYFRYGNVHIITDTPDVGDVATASKDQARKAGLRPYFEAITPLECPDWILAPGMPNCSAVYQAFRNEYQADAPRTSLTSKPQRKSYSTVRALVGGRYLITRYESSDITGQKSWQQVSQKDLGAYAELPVAGVICDPWLKDVAQLCLRLFNLESALDSQLNAQAFQRIIVSGNMSDGAKMAWSEYAVNFVPESSAVTVVEPSNPAALQARIEQTVEQLQRVAFNRSHALPADSKESPSADASNAMKEEQISLALQAVNDLETVINRAVKHWAMLSGNTNFNGKVTIGRDIAEEAIQDSIDRFMSLSDEIKKVPTWYKASLKRIVDREQLAEEVEIKKEIDALPNAGADTSTEDRRAEILAAAAAVDG